jgi:hypothetical protein
MLSVVPGKNPKLQIDSAKINYTQEVPARSVVSPVVRLWSSSGLLRLSQWCRSCGLCITLLREGLLRSEKQSAVETVGCLKSSFSIPAVSLITIDECTTQRLLKKGIPRPVENVNKVQ